MIRKAMAARVTKSCLLGVALTLIVAWGIALLVSFDPYSIQQGWSPLSEDIHWRWIVSGSRAIGSYQLSAIKMRHPMPTFSTSGEPPALDEDGNGWKDFIDGLPIGLSPQEFTLATDTDPVKWNIVARGWPLLAFRSDRLIFKGAPDQITGAIRLKGKSFEGWLPYSPIWKGLIGDASIYAILVFGILTAIASLRSFYRHFRGRCRACGYDLNGSRSGRCPECGVELP